MTSSATLDGTRRIDRFEAQLLRYRAVAFAALWATLVPQAAWTVDQLVRRHVAPADLLFPVLFVPAALILALSRKRARWWGLASRLLIAVGFLKAVADRLGFLGPPGTPEVSWGTFSNFIAYTAKVNAFAPPSLAPLLAVLSTLAEGILGIALALGICVRLASAASAILLYVFGTAMVVSGLSQFPYTVFLMAAGALALATLDASAMSLDAWVATRVRSKELTHSRESAPDVRSPTAASSSERP